MALLIDDEFLSSQYDKLDRSNINTIILEFYTLIEIETSKKVLISEWDKIHITDAISEFKKERKKTRSIEKNKEKCRKTYLTFGMSQMSKMEERLFLNSSPLNPSINAAKFNLQFLISSILELQENVTEEQNSIGSLTNVVTRIHRRLDVVSDAEPLSAEAASFVVPNQSPTPSRRQLPTPTPERSLGKALNLSSSLDVRRKTLHSNGKTLLNPNSPSYIPSLSLKPFLKAPPSLPVFSTSPLPTALVWVGNSNYNFVHISTDTSWVEFRMPIEIYERTNELRSASFGTGIGVRSALNKSKI